MRNGCFVTLVGYGGEQAPDEDDFANLFADILVLLVDVKAPEELYATMNLSPCPRRTTTFGQSVWAL